MDLEQLDRTAHLIVRDVLGRRRRGAPPLAEQFERTLTGLRPEEVGRDFVRSAQYAAYRELPHGEPGLCIEEAFFRYLEFADIGEPRIRRHEYLRAAALALLVQPNPAFTIPQPFVATEGGWIAQVGPLVYAALNGRFVHGRIS